MVFEKVNIENTHMRLVVSSKQKWEVLTSDSASSSKTVHVDCKKRGVEACIFSSGVLFESPDIDHSIRTLKTADIGRVQISTQGSI